MDASSVFDQLVRELSDAERRDLLQKIRTGSPISDKPLYDKREPDEEEASPIEDRLRRLGFFQRLLIAVQAFFTARKPVDVYVERLLSRLAGAIERKSPGIIEPRMAVFLPAFAEELERLKSSARFFYGYLESSIDRQRGDFYAFLASIELEETHRRLLAETNASRYADHNSRASEREVRDAVNAAFADIMTGIGEGQRAVMYRNVRALACLKALAAFPFEEILQSFTALTLGGPRVCYLYLVRERLLELADILWSFREPPSVSIFESLIVFSMRDRLGEESFDMSAVLKAELAKAEEALTRIRSFNAMIPLVDILRYATRDLQYRPAELPGGEDWFVIYKSFWRQRIDADYNRFLQERKRTVVAAEMAEFTGRQEFESFRFIGCSEPDAVPVRQARALAFLLTFLKTVFVDDINRPLKVLLIEGEFYKKENRLEFTNSYNALLKMTEEMQQFDQKLSPAGEIGRTYRADLAAETSPQARKRDLQETVRLADTVADGLVSRTRTALQTLDLVISGILHGEVGGRYDSVSDLGYLDGKNNKNYLRSLERARVQCVRAGSLLDELAALDARVFAS